MTTNPDPQPDRPVGGSPSIAEVTALIRRLRELSTPGRADDAAERAAFLADKDALIARITDTANTRDRGRSRADLFAAEAVREALTATVLARAAGDGYVLVGPSARTWRRDPATGRPTVAVTEAEHQAVRDLLGRYALDTTEPERVTGPDGRDDIHSTVVPARDDTDADDTHADDTEVADSSDADTAAVAEITTAVVGEGREGWLVDPAVAAGHPEDDRVAAERVAAQEAVLDAFYTVEAVDGDAAGDTAAGGHTDGRVLHTHDAMRAGLDTARGGDAVGAARRAVDELPAIGSTDVGADVDTDQVRPVWMCTTYAETVTDGAADHDSDDRGRL